MIWPFKKREPAVPFEEYIKTLATAPCGNQYGHYRWMMDNMPCAVCAGIELVKASDRHDRKMARLIAENIVAIQSPAPEAKP